MIKSFLISILFIFQFCLAVKAEIIPLTYGDLDQYMKLNRAQKTKYIYEFYKKNKKVGASDGEILNEILKINEINSDPIVEYLSDISKKVQNFETYAQYAIAEINKQIESGHPNQPEKFVDINDKDTWKNVKYVIPKVNPTAQYFESIIQKKCFSKPTYIKGAALLVASCAVKNKEQTKILSGIMVLLDEGYSILFQKNGEQENSVHLDFNDSSKKFYVSNFYYPVPIQNSLGDLILKKEMILPFELNILDVNEPTDLNVTLTLPICFNNECQNVTFPTTSLHIEQSPVHSEACIQLEQAKYLSLNNSEKTFKLNEIFIYPDKKTIELSIPKNNFSKKDNILLFGANIITEKPFILSDGDNYIYKFPILNSDKVSEDIRDIDVYIQQERQSFLLHQKLQTKISRQHFYSISFKNISLFFIFFLILFLCTPFSIGACFFICKIIHSKTDEETEEFFNFYIKSFTYSFFIIVGLLFALHYSKMFWGVHFNYPYLVYLYLMTFLLSLINLKRILISLSSQKQGILLGIMSTIFPLVSPLLSTQYQFYSIIKQSPLFFIIATYILHFIIMSFLFFLSTKIKFMDHYHSTINKLVAFPFCIPICLFVCIIFTQVSVIQFTLCIFCIFILLSLMSLKKIDIKYFVIIAVLNAFFLPINNPNINANIDIENYIKQENLLGNTILVSADESGCLICKVKKSIISYVLNRKKISKIKSIFVSYNNKWIRNQIEDTTNDILPICFINTEKNKQTLPNFIFPWNFDYFLSHQY